MLWLRRQPHNQFLTDDLASVCSPTHLHLEVISLEFFVTIRIALCCDPDLIGMLDHINGWRLVLRLLNIVSPPFNDDTMTRQTGTVWFCGFLVELYVLWFSSGSSDQHVLLPWRHRGICLRRVEKFTYVLKLKPKCVLLNTQLCKCISLNLVFSKL